MYRLLDVLASGVHDAKNELFFAETQIAAAEASHGIDLSEARYAIEDAAGRLSRTLSAYHLLRKDAALSIVPAVVDDLCAEIALDQKKHLAHAGIHLEVECSVRDEWPIDRDLITDALNNAVQNAGRYARSKVRLKAWNDETTLFFRVEDDGPGFAESGAGLKRGTGLIVAERIALLHQRAGRHGTLHLTNGGELGGGFFEMHLP